jgi:hypothetical protein
MLLFWKFLNCFICSYFQFYPKNGDHCSLYLATETELKSTYIPWTLKLKASIKNGQNIKEVRSMETKVKANEPMQRLGWDDFMKTNEIIYRSLYSALTLVIDVSISIFGSFCLLTLLSLKLVFDDAVSEESESECSENDEEGEINHFTAANSIFFNSDVFSDFKIICSDNKEFPIHRCIITTQSAVFDEMLRANNDTKTIMIKDFDGDTITELLRFIYTGKIKKIDYNQASKVINAARKFGVRDVIYLCVSNMENQLTLKNVFAILSLAIKYKDSYVQEKCLEFISL